jgi:TorA maturation chaperone TorD
MSRQEAEEGRDLVRAEGTEEMTQISAMTEQAGRRSLGYWLLSRMFLEVPTTGCLEDLRRTLGSYAATDQIAELACRIDEALVHPDDAAIAFTRHLVLGDRKRGEPLPFEAHVLEGQLPGECTRQVREMMLDAGYEEVAAEAPSPDHLGAELRFMALLCHEEYLAWLADRTSVAGEKLRLQRRFLTDHLAHWAPDYCEALAGRTGNGYLRAVAKLTTSTISDDLALLDDLCAWIPPEEFAPPVPTETASPMATAQAHH